MTARTNIGHLLRLGAWLAAYAVVAPLARLARAPRTVQVAFVAAVVAACVVAGPSSCTRHDLRIATFNIEDFGERKGGTDEPRLVELLRELDADVIAVQEIRDPADFAKLVADITAPGRRYLFVSSRCGGRRGLHVGFVVDSEHVRVVGPPVEFPGLAPGADDRCDVLDRPGLLATFSSKAGDFELLVVHFTAGAEPDAGTRRRHQWLKALKIVAQRRATGGPPIAIIGDVNSTGFLGDDDAERTFITGQLVAAGMTLPTAKVECSEYFQRDQKGPYLRSLLDHVALSYGFPVELHAEVHGYCRELGCPAQLDPLPRDFCSVSDHCPVSVGGRSSASDRKWRNLIR